MSPKKRRRRADFLFSSFCVLAKLVATGQLPTTKIGDGDVVSRGALVQYKQQNMSGLVVDLERKRKKMSLERRQKNFDKKHGKGSYERMKTLLADPRNSYAYIAQEIGITLQAISRWYVVLCPGNVKGHERQKLGTSMGGSELARSEEIVFDMLKEGKTYKGLGIYRGAMNLSTYALGGGLLKSRTLFLFDDKSGDYPMLTAKEVCKRLRL